MDVGPSRMSAPLLGEPLPVELMNTIWADREGLHDALAHPEGVAQWLLAVGSGEAAAWAAGPADSAAGPEHSAAGPEYIVTTPRLVENFRQLRDALRRLAAIATVDSRQAAAAPIGLDRAVAVVNRACAYAPTWSELVWPEAGEPHRDRRSARTPAETALAAIAEQGVSLLTGPDSPALRACQGPGCVLYFVRNHSRREWCSDICGNRARVARHYRRHHAATSELTET